MGDSGSGTLVISGGAAVHTTANAGVDGAVVGALSGAKGSATVTGAGSLWTVGSDLVVGDAGTGVLNVNTGAEATAGSLLVGASAAGTVFVSGTGSHLAVTGAAQIGGLGKATISVGTGGLVSVGGNAEVKFGAVALSAGTFTAGGTLTVDAGQSIAGSGTVKAGTLVDLGSITAQAGTLSFIGGIGGTGHLNIASGATLGLGAVGTGDLATFLATTGELALAAPTQFLGTIAGFTTGDAMDLASVIATSLTFSGKTLKVPESGGSSFGLAFSGSYTSASFAAPVSDGHGGTLIHHV